ncbi:MAG: HAD-IIIA family hydrolase [Candidatus Pacearchaeota archaeon]|jgi:D-glycero-D-manno-heptose 1,7-bisphosphate phosphatase
MNKAVFFDRDGVLNESIRRFEEEYNQIMDCAPVKVEDLKLKQNSKKIIDYIKDRGFKPIIITNQSDFLKKNIPLKNYEEITKKICEELGISRGQVFECLHKTGISLDCECKKPKPGMILMAKGLFNIDIKNSWLIGDSWKDISAAFTAGIENTIFLINERIDNVQEGNIKDIEIMKEKKIIPKFIIKDSLEIIDLIK